MAKVDLKNAFRICPVRKEDWHLLGICWQNLYYVDKCLPFGLRSAPYLFNMVTERKCMQLAGPRTPVGRRTRMPT